MLTLEIIVVFALFVLNGYFAMAELAIGLIIVPLMCHRKARRSNPFESRLVAVLPG
jgi:CBS domain containing-hemolysin-like protein